MEFTPEDVRDIEPVLTEIGIRNGTMGIPENMRWGRILAQEECVVAIQQLRSIAWFNFGILGNAFCEDYTSFFIDMDVDLPEFYQQLSASSEIPPDILAVLLSTREYAFEIDINTVQHLKEFCFPKTEEKKKNYLRIFNSEESPGLSEKSFYVHRQLMQKL